MGQDNRVHGTRAGAADTGDVDAVFIEQPFQHAPGKCTVGATTLEGEIDRDRFVRCFCHLYCPCPVDGMLASAQCDLRATKFTGLARFGVNSCDPCTR